MKNHVRIILRQALLLEYLPHWQALLGDRRLEREHFLPEVDRTFQFHGLPFLATREYQPVNDHWSADEITSGLDRVYRLILMRDQRVPPALINDLKLIPIIEHVSPGSIGQMELQPRSSSLSVRTDRASRDAIYLDEAQAFSTGDPLITVAVLDTGVDLGHRELRGTLQDGFDFVNILDGTQEFIGDFLEADAVPDDEVGHGTHVAGIVAGKGNNMPQGVVPRCKIIPVRVLAAMEKQGRRIGAGLIENINAGVKYAVDQGADVINMSLGGSPDGYPDEQHPLNRAVRAATEAGITVVAAVGNSGPDANTIGSPAEAPESIAVGASLNPTTVSDFSSRGPTEAGLIKPDVMAPGEFVAGWSVPGSAMEQTAVAVETLRRMPAAMLKKTMEKNPNLAENLGLPPEVVKLPAEQLEKLVKPNLPPTYIPSPGLVAAPGTSFAAPLVSGVLATLEEERDISPEEGLGLLRDTADSMGLPGTVQGRGFVDAKEALDTLRQAES
ncbi:MAG: S8 family serine peptidase [Candidatus Eremiobacteraeota bacterium]|nr:S8 family serine peptidase [Candidatus Eremiobacteraeota bacterium]